jgi:hypothetical protein
MNDLHARVLARLSEIEAIASAAHLPFRDHWRSGRKVGRTLYATETGLEDGHLIGVLDTPALAAHAAMLDPAFAFGLASGLRALAEPHIRIAGARDALCEKCSASDYEAEWPCDVLEHLAEALGLEIDDDDA